MLNVEDQTVQNLVGEMKKRMNRTIVHSRKRKQIEIEGRNHSIGTNLKDLSITFQIFLLSKNNTERF